MGIKKIKNICVSLLFFFSIMSFAEDKKLSQKEIEVFRRAMKSSQAKVDQLKIAIPQLQKDMNSYLQKAMDLERQRSAFLKTNPDISRLSNSNREKLSTLNRERRRTYEELTKMQTRLSGLKSDLLHADGRLLAARVIVEPVDLLTRDAVADGLRQTEVALHHSTRDKEKADEVVVSLNSQFDAEDMSLCLEQRLRSKLKDSVFYGRVSYNCSQQLAKVKKRTEVNPSFAGGVIGAQGSQSSTEKKAAGK